MKQNIEQAIAEQANQHNHLAELCYTNRLLVGLLQRLLSKFEEANGSPKEAPYILEQASPAQNTVYSGKPLAYDGVIRSMVVSGPGNVTVTMSSNLDASGSRTLAIIGCNGTAVSVNVHAIMPVNAKLQIATDSNAGTGLLALTAWIEPIAESGTELFRLRG